MKLHDGRYWWLALLGSSVVSVTIMAGLAIASPSDGTESRAHADRSHRVQTALAQSMVDRHQAMTELMRADMAEGMLKLMDADPMWANMRNPEFTQMLEDEQAQIDRMLGQGAP